MLSHEGHVELLLQGMKVLGQLVRGVCSCVGLQRSVDNGEIVLRMLLIDSDVHWVQAEGWYQCVRSIIHTEVVWMVQ